MIAGGRWNASDVPQIPFPLIQVPIARSSIDKKHSRGAFNQPAPIDHFNAPFLHRRNGVQEMRVGRRQFFDFDSGLPSCQSPFDDFASPRSITHRRSVQRPNECVSLSIFGRGHRCLGLQDGVDPADCARLVASAYLRTQRVKPRLATSVATSKRTWFWVSRFGVPVPLVAFDSAMATVP